MPCKSVCQKYEGPFGYKRGGKWCAHCYLWIKWDGTFCPCCKAQLRHTPRKSTFKRASVMRRCAVCSKEFAKMGSTITCSLACRRKNFIAKQKLWVATNPNKVKAYARQYQTNRRIHAKRKRDGQ